MFSSRLPPRMDVNALARALAALRDSATPYVDLTESNPTRAGIDYPAGLLDGLADGRALVYDPQPLGAAMAREAVAADALRRGASIDPAQVVLAASTSEAYSWLFKLLCNPGDAVLVPQPSYPLFEHLTRLEGVRGVPYALGYHGRWEVDIETLGAAPLETRAMVLVSPNNPTGSYVTPRELDSVFELCAARGWALVADEVFADYPLQARAPLTDLASRAPVLTFTLGGASKTVGLPQVKLGWIVVGGPERERRAAIAGLELIADTFLSVGTPVQLAAASLLSRGGEVRQAIHARVRENLRFARAMAHHHPACDILPVEGGWSAVVRVPSTRGEEALVTELLGRERVLVHPGYFFDFPHEAFLVFSLLPPTAALADALGRVLHAACTS